MWLFGEEAVAGLAQLPWARPRRGEDYGELDVGSAAKRAQLALDVAAFFLLSATGTKDPTVGTRPFPLPALLGQRWKGADLGPPPGAPRGGDGGR